MKVKEFNDPFYILGYPLEPIVKKKVMIWKKKFLK